MKGTDILLSDYLGIDYKKFSDKDIFDPIINRDSAFYINILRLKQAITPEFQNSYMRINNFFDEIALLLDNADEKCREDKCFNTAYKKFKFPGVKGINLGFSENGGDSGFGSKLRMRSVSDAFVIIKKGCKSPELFHMLALFEDDIGPDRLSDMIATIILPDIAAYTKRIQEILGINEKNYPDELFKNGILYNKFRKCPIYLLPEEIMHKLPIAKSWEDVDSVIDENNIIRNEINTEVGIEWKRWASSDRKNYLKRRIFMDAEICERVLNEYKKEQLERLELDSDFEYFITKFWQRIKKDFLSMPHEDNPDCVNSLGGTHGIIGVFKDWVENNRGWDEILNIESGKREKSVQRLIHLSAKYYVECHNLDLSCEANEGPGPVDFKISRGNDKTIVELKLSSNSDYLHGYEEQIERYAKAEKTDSMVYVLVDTGNPIRVKKLITLYEESVNAGKKVPEVIIINATRQVSASKRM